ncbi:MAG: helix-turn-helix domain-containing protein [Balneolaceae bacterium]
MKIDLQIIFLLIGLFQGLMIIIAALYQNRSKSNKLLAAALSALSILLFNNIMFYGTYSTGSVSILDFIIPEPLFLLGPLTYFYCKSLFEDGFKIRNSTYWHFLPSILDLFSPIYVLVVFALPLDQANHYRFLNTFDDYIVIPQFTSLTIYLFHSWKYLMKVRPLADSKTFKWARDFILGISIINLIWLPFLLLYISPSHRLLLDTVYFHPIFYTLSAFFYFLSFRILKGGLSFRPNPITQSELDINLKRIQTAIVKNGMYRNPELNLKQLSFYTDIPEKTLSFIFKHYHNKGFNQYINEFRIQEAFNALKDGSKNFSIEGIALDAGFSSRATFYRTFKQITGKSPNEVLKKQN